MTIRTVRRRIPVKPSAGVECPTELGAQSSAHNHSIKCASPITLRACPTGKSRRPKIGGHTGKSQTDMIILRLSERPDLIDRVYEVDQNWPEFMRADPVMNAFFGQVAGMVWLPIRYWVALQGDGDPVMTAVMSLRA